MNTKYPGVSCVCITYKRTKFLEEAIESFLKQDYLGKKELIIVNDDNEQTLIFEHPEVKIYNFKDRFSTIGEKRNKSIELSSYDIIML
jgi:glycosyltransferase involved in cell wall biosynthesis